MINEIAGAMMTSMLGPLANTIKINIEYPKMNKDFAKDEHFQNMIFILFE